MTKSYKAVVVGVSAGGFDALSIVIPALGEDFSLPIAVAQHRHADSDEFLAMHLDNRSRGSNESVHDSNVPAIHVERQAS